MVARTPGGSVSAAGRRASEKRGHTMAGGRFPIDNTKDLANAKHDIGRAKGSKAAVKAWINKRADELGAPRVGKAVGGPMMIPQGGAAPMSLGRPGRMMQRPGMPGAGMPPGMVR